MGRQSEGPLQRDMKAWRHALGLEVLDCVAAARAGISVPNWSKIENGHPGNYRPNTYAAIDRAFAWPHGTAQGLANGTIQEAPPIPENGTSSDPRIASMQREIRRQGEMIQRLADHVADLEKQPPK